MKKLKGDLAVKNKVVDLTNGPITRNIILFALPLLLSNLFQQLYNSVDTAVVGQFSGSIALAAVGSTGALINLLIGFFMGLATGAGVLYAMHFGAGDNEGLKKITDASYILAIGISVVITAVGVIFAPQLLRLMDTPDDVMKDATAYLRIFLAGTIFNMVYNVGAGMIRSGGDSTRPLIYLFFSGVINLILDLVFVAGLGMGAAGAALATIMAQAVSAVLVVWHMMCRLPVEQRFQPLNMRLDKVAVMDVVRISLPCGLQGSMFNISNFLVQMKINSFGSVAMAGAAAYSKVDGFIYMPTNALSMSATTYVGQNIGAGCYERVKKGVRVCLVLAVCICMCMCTTVVLAFDSVIGIFATEAEVQAFARQQMLFMAPFSWIFVFADVLGGAMRGAGAAMPVTIITAICVCVVRIIWLLGVLPFFNDIRVVFFCYPMTWALCTTVMVIYYFKCSAMKWAIRASEVL